MWPIVRIAVVRALTVLVIAIAILVPGTIYILSSGYEITSKALALLVLPGVVVLIVFVLLHSLHHLRFLHVLTSNVRTFHPHPQPFPTPQSIGDAETALLALTESFQSAQTLDTHKNVSETGAGAEALLSRRIVADEQIQSALAAELHDTVAQSLIAAQWALEATGPNREEEALKHIRAAERQLRDILSQAVLPDLSRGVAQLTKDLVAAIKERHGLTVHIENWPTTPISLTSTAAITLHRFHQEAFTNIVKHAGVREATLKVEHLGPILRSTVSDKGKGFTLDSRNRHNLGLTTMGIRARSCGGRTELFTTPGQGTTVTLSLPVRS